MKRLIATVTHLDGRVTVTNHITGDVDTVEDGNELLLTVYTGGAGCLLPVLAILAVVFIA